MFLCYIARLCAKPLEFVSKCQCFKGQHAGVQKKRKRRGDFLQDTCPGNLVQLHPARHPQTFIMFFRSNCQPFHARSYLPWRSGFQRLSLQSSAVNFLKLFTFRIFTGVDRKSSALSCPSWVSCGCFFQTVQTSAFFFFLQGGPIIMPECLPSFRGVLTESIPQWWKGTVRNFTTEIVSSEFSNKYPGRTLTSLKKNEPPKKSLGRTGWNTPHVFFWQLQSTRLFANSQEF